ncbi:WG repeat-containing protein [Edaphobacter sp.]|uniref:WG repeat-containing protein n=1 Tax=Edaphobacter sp. TaxID=1934404 RepID=UPI002DB9D6D3|nr:WG repeat-containing protein [Edaphobacter sp.]HEU5340960.1 WG repeat-containing protein [Edaphobacter sp.]
MAVAPPLRQPASPLRKAAYALGVLLVILASVGWWWFHRPPPPYKVQDPGIYPFQSVSADGKAGKWGFVDADGKIMVQPEWDAVAWEIDMGHPMVFNEGLCGVQKDGKWGYIDTGGHLVIPTQFDSVSPFVEGLAKVNLGKQVGFIDKTGHYAINPQFDDAYSFHNGLAVVRADGGWGFIDKTGAYAIKPSFQTVDPNGFWDGLAMVCQGKCGYINRDGKFVIKAQFDGEGPFSEGMASVQVDNKWGYINTAGTIVVNPQFDQASAFSGGLAAVSASGHTGTIDKQGKYVVNPGQYNMVLTEGGPEMVTSSDGVGLLGRDGKWIVKPSKAISSISAVFEKVFYGVINGQTVPISMSGKVLAGSYKGAMLDSLGQDIENEKSALESIHMLTAAEASYSNSYPTKGFTASLEKLGPAQGTPDENRAGLIDAALATGTKDGYQFTVRIPDGTSTGGTNFNYFIEGKPATGHVGRIYCADSSGTVNYALPGKECTTTPPTP